MQRFTCAKCDKVKRVRHKDNYFSRIFKRYLCRKCYDGSQESI